jgi:hypothetical protein
VGRMDVENEIPARRCDVVIEFDGKLEPDHGFFRGRREDRPALVRRAGYSNHYGPRLQALRQQMSQPGRTEHTMKPKPLADQARHDKKNRRPLRIRRRAGAPSRSCP